MLGCAPAGFGKTTLLADWATSTNRSVAWLSLERVEEATRWTRGRGLTAQDQVSNLRERDHLVLARVLLAQSQPDRALGLLERLDALAQCQGRTGCLIGIRAVRALALQAAGDHQGAVSLLAESLT